MYILRYAERLVQEISQGFKVLYIGGARQVGKTTLLNHLSQDDRQAVTLDSLDKRTQAQEDPALFLQQFIPPVLIDEIQHAPDLLSYIKLNVDQGDKRGQFWLTGSQQFALMKGLRESLAGRVGIIHLLGLSWAEIERRPMRPEPWWPGRSQDENYSAKTIGQPELFQRIWRGSFPVLWQDQAPSPEQFYSSYVDSYIDRDVAAFFGLEKIAAFHTFLELAAARTGQLLNYSDLARDAGISVPTAKEWIGILEATSQIMLLRPYHRNISKRMVKSPKLYWLDTGLAAHLARWNSAESLMRGASAGAFFETFVVSEIVKSYQFRGIRPPLHFARDRLGNEIDVVIEQNQKLYPIEIKMAAQVDPRAATGADAFTSALPEMAKEKTIVCLTDKIFRSARDVTLVPVTDIQ